MTGACHHLSPASVVRDARYQAHKAFPSIAGAKIRINLVSTKFRHVIRSDFQQTYDLKVSLKNNSMFMRRISMFCGIENYVLLYKSAYYEVIPVFEKRVQYSVFFAVVSNFCIDSILYI